MSGGGGGVLRVLFLFLGGGKGDISVFRWSVWVMRIVVLCRRGLVVVDRSARPGAVGGAAVVFSVCVLSFIVLLF